MARLRKILIAELEKIPGIDIHLWKPDRELRTWLVVRFTRESHLPEMVRLVKMAIKLR